MNHGLTSGERDLCQAISELVADRKWAALESLIKANVSYPINRALVANLFDAPAKGRKYDLQRALIETKNGEVLSLIVVMGLQEEHALKMREFLPLIIESVDEATGIELSNRVFSERYSYQLDSELRLLIEKAGPATLAELAKDAFSRPEATQRKHLLKLFMEKAGLESSAILAANANEQLVKTAEMQEFVQRLIASKDPAIREILVREVLPRQSEIMQKSNKCEKVFRSAA